MRIGDTYLFLKQPTAQAAIHPSIHPSMSSEFGGAGREGRYLGTQPLLLHRNANE